MHKLLVVEDDALLYEAYQRKFSNIFDIKVAVDGQSGIDMAKTWMPEVILLDLYMAGKYNGLDVLEWVKREPDLANIPVLVVTNLVDAAEKVMKMGASKCIMKSDVDLEMIQKEVEALLPPKL